MRLRPLHLHGHAQNYTDFARHYPHFYLLASDHDYPEDWLLRKLHDDGAQVHLLGRIIATPTDHYLCEVFLPASQ